MGPNLYLRNYHPIKSTQLYFFSFPKSFKFYSEVISENAACLVWKLKYLGKIIPILLLIFQVRKILRFVQ